MHYHHRNINKLIENAGCAIRHKKIKHIVLGCTTPAPSEYTNRHSMVAGYIHWTICKHMGLEVTDKYYEHLPERVI